MTNDGQFYTLITSNNEVKTININHIAVVEDASPNTKITMTATRDDGKSISFISALPYNTVVLEIRKMEMNLK